MQEDVRCLKYNEIQGYLRNRYPLLMVDYAPEVVPGKYANGGNGFFNVTFPGIRLCPEYCS